jgi:hypothetical protein
MYAQFSKYYCIVYAFKYYSDCANYKILFFIFLHRALQYHYTT